MRGRVERNDGRGDKGGEMETERRRRDGDVCKAQDMSSMAREDAFNISGVCRCIVPCHISIARMLRSVSSHLSTPLLLPLRRPPLFPRTRACDMHLDAVVMFVVRCELRGGLLGECVDGGGGEGGGGGKDRTWLKKAIQWNNMKRAHMPSASLQRDMIHSTHSHAHDTHPYVQVCTCIMTHAYMHHVCCVYR